jgi:hypothetical protein
MSDSVSPELMTRLLEVARAIDGVLIAEHGPRAALKAPPPWNAPPAAGIARYGAGPVFDLWMLCRAVEALRVAWTGRAGPAVAAEPEPVAIDAPADPVEPDEGPGVLTDPADAPDERQQRLDRATGEI